MRWRCAVTACRFAWPTSRHRTERQRVRAAYHESGHAVVGLALGIDVRSVSLVPDPSGLCDEDQDWDSYGRTDIVRSVEPLMLTHRSRAAEARVELRVRVAGPMAEARFAYARRPWNRYHRQLACGSDEAMIELLVTVQAHWAGVSEREYLDGIVTETIPLIERHWGSVKAATRPLVASGWLDAEQLRGLRE